MPNTVTLRSQLTKLTLLISGVVLVVACTALFAYQYFVLRDSAVSKAITLGAVVANNSTAALAFNNADDAHVSLTALKAEPQIAAAALYDRNGSIFAKYPDSLPMNRLPAAPPDDGFHFSGSNLIVSQAVAENDAERLGTLYLESSMNAIYASYSWYAVIITFIMFASAGLAYWLSARLQRQVSQPILALTETATSISSQRDYSVRALKPAGYEVGLLTDAFNHMLGRIQAQVGNLDLLQRITRSIAERQDLPSIARTVIGNLEDNLAVDFGCICVYHPIEETITLAGVGPKSAPLALQMKFTERSSLPIEQNGLSKCVRGNLVYEPDIADASARFPTMLAGAGMRSLVIAPLLVESTVFGVLVVARRAAESFSSADCEFLRQLSEHVALSAHQTQLHGALQQAYEDLRQSQMTVLQQERLRALGQMASGIAHDINNAISPVSLYTESLLEREPNLSERARNYLTTIQRAIEDVANTVARMREFYRHREPELVLTTISLDRLAQQVIDLTRARWSDLPQEHGIVIRLETDFEPNLPRASGAEAEIRDALTNLIFNAIDAMPNGGTLTVRTRALNAGDKSSEAVAIEISDTGIGMSAETRQRCLEPFFTTKGERGTGLGLPMVYGMVQRHSATLEIDSAPGQGTTVRIIFPIANSVITAAPNTAAPKLARRLRILIVDDDPLLIKSLRDSLEGDGHQVTAADGGQAGIDAFNAAEKRAEPFDIVITDLGMPYVDGRKVAAQIKERSPDMPVVMLTGWGQRLLDENDVPPHVDRVLSKPPRLHELRAALSDFAEPNAAVLRS